MIKIEGHWEYANDLRDISKIIREYYNPELAKKLDYFIEAQEDKIERLEVTIEELDWRASNADVLEDEVYNLECEIKNLKRKIDELESSDCTRK